MNILEFLNKEETYEEVLKLITLECEMGSVKLENHPIESFISGGAVANTIYYLLNKEKFKKPVINDVDLFCFNHTPVNSMNYCLEDEFNFINTNMSECVGSDSYSRTWVGPYGESVRMVSSERIGLINKIIINVNIKSDQIKFDHTKYYKTLIDNFDLNCTMAGLDRVQKKIIFNKEFVYFLETNKIEVRRCDKPIQTAIRLKQKSEQLITDISNFDFEISLLQHSFLFATTTFIGELGIQKINTESEFIDKYFYKVTNDDLTNVQVYTTKDFTINKIVDQFTLFNSGSLVALWDIYVRIKKDFISDLTSFYIKEKGLDMHKPTRVWSYKELMNEYLILSPQKRISDNFITILTDNPKFFDCDFDYSDLVKLDSFINFIFENGLYRFLSFFILENINEQILFINSLEKTYINKFTDFRFSDKFFNRVLVLYKNNYNVLTKNSKEKIDIVNKILKDLWLGYDKPLFKYNFLDSPTELKFYDVSF